MNKSRPHSRRPLDPSAAAIQLKAYLDGEKYASALRLSQQLMQHQPDEPGYCFVAAHCLLNLGKSKAAERLLRQALRRFANDGLLMYKLGMALIAQNRFQEAVEQFRYALAIIPPEMQNQRAQNLCGLGEALWLLEERDEAIGAWKEAQHEEPQNEKVKAFLKNHLNEYGEPKSPRCAEDDFNHFLRIHVNHYIETHQGQTLGVPREANRVRAAIHAAWSEHIVPRLEDLKTMTAAEKTALFSRISIDFDNPPPQKIIPLYPGKDPPKTEQERKILDSLNAALPFFPPGGSELVLLYGTEALMAAGMPLRRLKSFFTGKAKATHAEQDLFVWAFELLIAVVSAAGLGKHQEIVASRHPEERNDAIVYAILDAVDIAAECLSLDESLAVVRGTYDLLAGSLPSSPPV